LSEPAFGTRKPPWLSGGADPDASWKIRWSGLRHQDRQQQLQTRLKSTCRRPTNNTGRWRLSATVTWPLCH